MSKTNIDLAVERQTKNTQPEINRNKQEKNQQQHYLNFSKKCDKTRIASVNADSLRTNQSMQNPTLMLTQERIDIACIQETQWKNGHARN